eukprot:TRINITY_DN6769_c0_g1_i1.p1 TRINITY_DN6769_c0_g1~~TRINITY_DN6769_c0_g1_i1.p1  ORF type:complete len:694 (-),score=273.39 TRINITY_DN6769_c0_g1_i1:62-1840(-)
MRELLRRKEELRCEIQEARSRIKQVGIEIDGIKSDIKHQELSLNEMSDLSNKQDVERIMLETFWNKVDLHIKTFRDNLNRIQRINSRHEEIRMKDKNRRESNAFSMGGIQSSSNNKIPPSLNHKKMKEIQKQFSSELSEYFEDQMSSSLNKGEDEDSRFASPNQSKKKQSYFYSKSLDEESKEKLRNLDATPLEVAESLTQMLKDISLQVDEKKMKKDGNNEKDEMEEKDQNQLVSQLLGKLRTEHVSKFVAKENLLNQSALLKEEASILQKKRNEMIKGSRDFEGLKKYLNAQIEKKCSDEILGFLELKASEIREEISEKEGQRKSLKVQREQIESLERQRDEQQSLIEWAIQQNMYQMRKISKEVENSHQFIEESAITASATMKNQRTEISNWVSNELETFDKTNLSVLLHSGSGGNVRKMELHDLHQTFGNKSGLSKQLTELQSLQQASNFPWEKSADMFVGHWCSIIDSLEHSAEQIKQRMLSFQEVASNISKRGLNGPKLDEILEKYNLLAEIQEREWLPQLEEMKLQIEQSMQECTNVKNLAEDWWNQPAVFLVPWLKVNGENFQQTLEKLMSRYAEIRHMESNLT